MNGDTVSPGVWWINSESSRKSTAFAAEEGAKAAGEAKDRGMIEVHVRLNGAGAGREAAVRGIISSGLKVLHHRVHQSATQWCKKT